MFIFQEGNSDLKGFVCKNSEEIIGLREKPFGSHNLEFLNQNSREGHESFGIKKEEKKENSKGGLYKVTPMIAEDLSLR